MFLRQKSVSKIVPTLHENNELTVLPQIAALDIK